jgi:hypothetical protein
MFHFFCRYKWQSFRHLRSSGLLAYSGNSLPTFRDNLEVPSSRVVKMRPMGCPEMSTSNYHCTLRNYLESSNLRRKPEINKVFLLLCNNCVRRGLWSTYLAEYSWKSFGECDLLKHWTGGLNGNKLWRHDAKSVSTTLCKKCRIACRQSGLCL